MSDNTNRGFSRREYCKALGAAGAIGVVGPIGTATAQESVGNGGYHVGPPAGAETHEYGRHTTSNFGDRPVPTNDWYSAIPLEGISGDDVLLAAHPLIFRTRADGLAVGHPTTWTTDWNEGDQVGNAGMDAPVDLTISHVDAGNYGDLALDDHGDWSASAVFDEGTASSLRFTIAQGSPFVFCEPGGTGGVELSFGADVDVFRDDGNVVGVTVGGNDYGLYASEGGDWSIGAETATGGGDYCTIAILPDPSFLETYERYAYNRVTDTIYDWEYDQQGGEVRTTFSFETATVPESDASGTITALFPHQWKYSDAPDLDATYPSARGEMRIATGDSFTVTDDYGGMLPFLPDEGTYDRTQLEGLIREAEESIQGGVDQDTYRFGKDTASRLAKTAAVADQIGLDDKRDALLEPVRQGLEEWFTPSETSTFYYDDSIGVLQGIEGSHGSVTDVSDHHFHFGHYVWAAARVARHDPEWAAESEWGGMVEELVADYANPDRGDDEYPFNRNFSVYEGHSWAHGSGSFADGNNQESSSEALMSYAAMIEWGEYTGNTEIRDFGIALYSTHVRSVQEYWYDIDGENFPNDWETDFAGIVWGNSVAHSTWWTADSEAVFGINMLPMSGYSMHLGWDDELAERTFDEISALKDDHFTYWPDVLWMYRAFSDSQDAIQRFESQLGSYDAEDAQEPGHTMYWLYNLDAMGSPDASVTADTPFYTVFGDGSERTYAAYNASDSGTTVSFSDGTELYVPANTMATSSDDYDPGDGDGDDDGGDGEGDGNDGDDSSGQQPYLGTPHSIPGRIQAQHYDEGGQDVAYHDTTADNQGGDYRTDEGVDVEAVSDSTGGEYNVGWITEGEWLEYTVNVAESATYDVTARVASDGGDGALSMSVDGQNVTGTIDVPDTGDWQSWTTVTAGGVSLSAGERILRLSMEGDDFNLNWIEFELADGDGGDGGDDDDSTYSGDAGDSWSASVSDDGNESTWSFEPNNGADWADVQFADPGTDAWVGYRMDDAGDNVHEHARDTSGDGDSIDVRFVWDDGAGGQYVSGRRTHSY